jgi:hypothetical protein
MVIKRKDELWQIVQVPVLESYDFKKFGFKNIFVPPPPIRAFSRLGSQMAPRDLSEFRQI